MPFAAVLSYRACAIPLIHTTCWSCVDPLEMRTRGGAVREFEHFRCHRAGFRRAPYKQSSLRGEEEIEHADCVSSSERRFVGWDECGRYRDRGGSEQP